MAATGPTISASPASGDGPAAGEGEHASYALSSNLVTMGDERASEAEAVRTIRTHIVARHIKDGRRGLAVCAPAEGAGCTFTATNLAVALAQVGISTLLIDGDMRRPAVEEFIRPQREMPGLMQCIADDATVSPSSCIHNEVLPNLSIMYSGGRTHNAQELLAGDPFKRLIEGCLRDYEFTIVDTPPTNQCADARRIGTIIGYTLIVARARVTLTSEVAMLAGKLQEDGVRVVGTVLNEA
jgi:protein-tyrosine kinase